MVSVHAALKDLSDKVSSMAAFGAFVFAPSWVCCGADDQLTQKTQVATRTMTETTAVINAFFGKRGRLVRFSAVAGVRSCFRCLKRVFFFFAFLLFVLPRVN